MTLSDLTSKTPEELNVMCAEALGWTNCKLVHNKNEGWSVLRGKNPVGEWADVPNYTGSWDAIMPEVSRLNEEQGKRFVLNLYSVFENAYEAFDHAAGEPVVTTWYLLTATAQQLTIALILTLTSQH